MEKFVHLHVHSQYSILDGQASVANLLKKAMNDGMEGIALTDHGAMFGIKDFINTLKDIKTGKKGIAKDIKKLQSEVQSIEERSDRSDADNKKRDELLNELAKLEAKMKFKPIIGCEAYCARRTRHNKDSNAPDPYKPKRSIDSSGWHLVLLAKNKTGYKNLIKMVSLSWTEGYYYRPRIDKELLEKYHEGIIVSSACLGGEIPQHIMNGRIDEAEKSIEWFKSIFGDDYYLEIQRHQTNNPLGNASIFEEQQKVNSVILELAKKHNVKVIATNDVHFVNEDDAEAHDRLVTLSTGRELNDPNRMRYSKQEWLKTTKEMNEVFADIPEVLRNTNEILAKIEEYSIDSEPLMPDFPIPEGYDTADDYLRYLTYKGAEAKYGINGLTQEVKDRLDFELETIKSMGFPGYFLIVQDFIKAAKDMGVFVGPGRGSAAGSAVAYSLDITNIDPIKYDLLFERFLNPDRISMPDIDIDFDDDGRADILQWVTDKYGKDRVAHIITYGTMATKSAIKDVARVVGLPLAESNRLAKLVPDKLPNTKKITLDVAIDNVPELKTASISPDEKVYDTIKYARQLEGSIRNTGVHACGIIIGKTDINEVVPLSTATDKDTGEDIFVTQYEGKVIEETGLIKMDFLGLKTLSVIKEALLNIKERTGEVIDIEKIPIDDEKTFKLYSEGRTIGTFQFESAGMQKYLRELQPNKFEDLIAMNALYRPGPIQYIPQFINRKHGIEPITYPIDSMERYLKDTYGITVYQEQVMLLSRELAGFTRGESDNLRKAMGKKLKDKMAELKVKFINGGTANGHSADTLEKIWSDWEKFAEYAFNKSHSTCYSWVAYQTAYLKANYPAEYMAGALSRNLGNGTEITKLMSEAKAMGIKVLVPDVNESSYKFSVNKKGDIRFGLSAIKGVGIGVAEAIIEERKKGLFVDIFDFFQRMNPGTVNKKVLESLIFSGAFDMFGIEREIYMETADGAKDNFINQLMKYGYACKEDAESQANSLFDFDDESMAIPKPEIPKKKEDFSTLKRLNLERELIGVFLSDHPLTPYRVILEAYANSSTEALNEGVIDNMQDGAMLQFGGIISKTFEGLSKKGSEYGRMTIEDTKGSYELILFGTDYINFRNFFKEGLFVLLRSVVKSHPYRPNEKGIQIQSIDLLSEVADTLISNVKIDIDTSRINSSVVSDFIDLASREKGNQKLSVSFSDPISKNRVDTEMPHRINFTADFMDFCRNHGFEISVS